MREPDSTPTIGPTPCGAVEGHFWRSAVPDVEVLERRDSPAHRGVGFTYAFAFQPAPVPCRVRYRGGAHDAPTGAVILAEPGEAFEVSGPSSANILFVSCDLISRVALDYFGYVKPVHWRTVVVPPSLLSEELLSTIGTLRNACGQAAEAVVSKFIISCITQLREPTREPASSDCPKIGLVPRETFYTAGTARQ